MQKTLKLQDNSRGNIEQFIRNCLVTLYKASCYGLRVGIDKWLKQTEKTSGKGRPDLLRFKGRSS